MGQLDEMKKAARSAAADNINKDIAKMGSGELNKITIDGNLTGYNTASDPNTEYANKGTITDTTTTSKLPTNIGDIPGDLKKPNYNVKVTPEDKKAFMDALVFDKRFSLDFSFMGGRLTGTAHSKTIKENRYIVDFVTSTIKSEDISNDADYYQVLRCVGLAVHVSELNGNVLFNPNEDTGVEGIQERYKWWLERDNKNPAAQVIVYNFVRELEQKYLAMLEASRDENFWKTGEHS